MICSDIAPAPKKMATAMINPIIMAKTSEHRKARNAFLLSPTETRIDTILDTAVGRLRDEIIRANAYT